MLNNACHFIIIIFYKSVDDYQHHNKNIHLEKLAVLETC